MNPIQFFLSLNRFPLFLRKSLAIMMVILFAALMSSCGSSDAEPQVKKFCAQVKTGESVMKVAARAGKVDFDKYWFEKYDKDPSKGEVMGVIRPRDLEKKTKKLNKLKHPESWNHGRFKAMIQELGYSRHVCSVDFSKAKVLKKTVLKVD